jgi:hypothetical protein
MIVNSWLTEDDVQRLWDVAHGELPAEFASEDELIEFARIVEIVGRAKWGLTDQPIH